MTIVWVNPYVRACFMCVVNTSRGPQELVFFIVSHLTLPFCSSGKGAVTGMLKTGKKGLYVFDRDGHHYQVQPPCVLDFYVHESRQRTGLGKQLFEHMLQVSFAIVRT